MERYLSSRRKVAGILILLLIFILPCGAESKNRQRVISLDDDIYKDVDTLYMLKGFAPPSYGRPWSEDEVDRIMAKIDPVKLSEQEKRLYDNIYKNMEKRVLLGKEEKAFMSVKAKVNLEAFAKINKDRDEWVHGYEERLPLFNVPVEFFLWDNMYIDVDLSLREAHDVASNCDYDYSNIPENIKFIDPSIPYRAFMSVGGNHWNVQLGRDKLSWGNSKVSNMLISDYSDWYNFLKFTTYWKILKFTAIYAGMESYLTSEEKDFDAVGEGLTRGNYENFRERYKAMMAHRLEARFTDKFNMAVSEAIIFGNKYPEFSNINPVGIFHSVFAPEYSNVMFSIEADYAITKGLSVYAQFAMDELKLSIENSESARPSALGYLAGIRYLFPCSDGVMKLCFEGARTDPYLYNRWHPLTKFTNRRRYWSYLDDGYLYVDKPTGYRHGPDAVVLYLESEFRIPSNIKLSADLKLKFLGELNDSLSDFMSYDTGSEANSKKSPSGSVKTEAIVGLHGEKQLSKHFALGGDIYYIRAESDNDAEFAVHCTYKY